eukprot:TRINITY_DN662_c1_g1_i2.p1 TRINITY_DN662_c1_g1~~TRINITY_DN662_c1_g1_i2.p1  ORF type:complete len:140 (+),score=25.80 TRINITY_DN662_c1_g1_i2:156-575(+)
MQLRDSFDRYGNHTVTQYRAADAILLQYDITSQNSFDQVCCLLQEVKRGLGTSISTKPILLTGNKTDLANHRMVAFSSLEEIANQSDLLFQEISVLQNEHVDTIFEMIVDHLIEQNELRERTTIVILEYMYISSHVYKV